MAGTADDKWITVQHLRALLRMLRPTDRISARTKGHTCNLVILDARGRQIGVIDVLQEYVDSWEKIGALDVLQDPGEK